MDSTSQSPASAYLSFLTGPLAGVTVPVTQFEITLGRHSKNGIVVQDPGISRFHARLMYREGSWQIERLSQTSLVYVDQSSVERATLKHNSKVELGKNVSLYFLLHLPSGSSEVSSKEKVELQVEKDPAEFATQLLSDASDDRFVTSSSPTLSSVPTVVESISPPSGTVIASPEAMGMPSLEVVNISAGTRRQYLLAKKTLDVGSDARNNIVIAMPGVADFHVQIVQQEKNWHLLYPHPWHGTAQNSLLYAGRTLPAHESFRKALVEGDTFRLGDDDGALITLIYHDGRGEEKELSARMQHIELGNGEVTFGRLADNTVVLDHPQVSGHHARLVKVQGFYTLIDVGSTNRTYVNGLQVSHQQLQRDDEIRIGPYKLVFDGTQIILYDESGGIRIDVLDIRQVSKNQTVLLDNISLSIPPRSFVALVGASGAGKSTLLDALNGLRPAQQGMVFYNGQDYYQNLAAFRTQIGYVPQDEIIHRDITVERVLYYTAKLRLPKDFTQEQITQRIDEVLDDVEMQHRRNLLVRQLSGGQRKRVSIALELLAKPSVFFLDEPTSGLDPGLDRKMMVLLRKLADKGHTVVLVTHATNNINVCDYVCFLAPGGHLAYFGPPEQAKTYFEKGDFPEIYSVLEPGDSNVASPGEIAAQFQQSPTYQQYIGAPLNRRPKSNNKQALQQKQRSGTVSHRGTAWRQFLLLSMRYLELLKNDRGNLAILLLQAPLIGLLLLVFIKGIGPGGFNATAVVQCKSTATIVAAAGFPDVPTPIDPIVSNSCQRVKNFLVNNPTGEAYARKRGGVTSALQDFLVNGTGYAPTILFIMAFSAIMFGSINSIREIVKEMPIYRRERAVNLGIFPYMASKIAVLGVLCLVQSFILMVCVTIFDPIGHSVFLPPFLETYITIALTSLAGLMMGLMVSALVPNNDRAMSFLPLILIPQVVFSGAIFPLTAWYLQYPAMLFPIRWAMAALGSSVGLHSDKLFNDQLFGNVATYQGTLFSIYSQEDAVHYLTSMWLALGIIIILLGIAISYFLKQKDRRV
jgi:ABC-type multidrug transport system ATPase subunit